VGKVLKVVSIVASIAALAVPGMQALGFIGLKTALTISAVAGITAAVAGIGAQVLAKVPRAQLSRLNVSLDPSTSRKAVLGDTAMPLDLRYHEASGTDQEFIDYIIAVAAHKVASIDQIWFEQTLAWSATGGVSSTYAGYLTVTTRTEGAAGNVIPINAGTVWDSSCRLTGCAYVRLRIKRTGNTKKTESPLVQGLPSRITIIGEGALLYDPRLDSTVPGGSGSHRANDQATWGTYVASETYDNPALQLLWFLLGWKINGKLSVGAGVPPPRIDMESFITAANLCDESIALASGGTQPRYRASGVVGDDESRMDAIQTLLTSMNATLRDNGGKLTLSVLKNDLADPVLDFTDGDFLGEFVWDQTGGGLSQGYNIARGRFIDPSTNSLYQLAEYPEVSIPSPDGIERVMSLDLPFVEDGRRAQRIAKQALQRVQFRGQLNAEFSAKALGCDVGDIVRITLGALGFNQKPFRVMTKEIRPDGRVPLTLIEESQLIYQWDKDDLAPVVPRTPVVYDPLLNMITQGDDEAGATANWSGIINDDGNLPENNADVTVDNQITFNEIDPFTIQADSTGTTSTTLPVTRGIRLLRGGVVQTSGVTLGTVTTTGGLTASASVSSGLVTVSLSVANAVGYITVPIIFGGVTYPRLIVVNRTVAAPIAGGTAGSTSFTDQTWDNISSTSFVQVTDTGAQIVSDSSGRIRFQASAGYEGSGEATIKAQHSTDGTTWTDGTSSSTGTLADDSNPFEPLFGFVGLGPTTVTGLSASTNYFVRLVAKLEAGGSSVSWLNPTFTANHP
jgi:hypothetical protein